MGIKFNYDLEPRREILCIDCKSFYASVECVERGLDPLKTMLVVMSRSEDESSSGSGLILASSPLAKKKLGISNVSRQRDLLTPYPKELVIAPPRMRLYMKKNKEINGIYLRFVAPDDHHVYSVDESFLDVTDSLKYFGCETADEIAKMIQTEVYRQTGIYTTVGIGDNPLLAKLALDNGAKHNPNMRAEWRYEDVPEKLWTIDDIEEIWGIGRKTSEKLKMRGIRSMYDLAHSDYYAIKENFGIIGAQLYAGAWGIDRSFIGNKIIAKSSSIGNSQVLMKDYNNKDGELDIIVREMSDQVATRMRRKHVKTQNVSLWIGYSAGYIDSNGKSGFAKSCKIAMTNSTDKISEVILAMFHEQYTDQIVRHVGVSCGRLVATDVQQLSFFESPDDEIREEHRDKIVDQIRRKYGFSSVIRASSIMEGATAVNRSKLVAGHAGGMEGIE